MIVVGTLADDGHQKVLTPRQRYDKMQPSSSLDYDTACVLGYSNRAPICDPYRYEEYSRQCHCLFRKSRRNPPDDRLIIFPDQPTSISRLSTVLGDELTRREQFLTYIKEEAM